MERPEGIVEGAKLGGHFQLEDSRSILGDLTIDGIDTSLYLHDPEFFDIDRDQARAINGTLHDRTRVTLLDCTITSSHGSATRYNEHFKFAELQPSYIVSGNRHLAADEPTITKVAFHIDDAEAIFYDFDALGHVIDARPIIDIVVQANEQRIDRKIPTGPSPEVFYFAGRTELADIATAIGQVRIIHQPVPSSPLSSPRYAGIQNWTLIEITFPEPQLLKFALSRIKSVLRFLAILGGRPQNIENVRLHTADEPKDRGLDLYWTHRPQRPSTWEDRRPHPAEILIPIVDQANEFATVLQNWLALEPDRLEARVRFQDAFEQQRVFSIDRLVGATNMFDILPSTAFPPFDPLEADLEVAKSSARATFRKLPRSVERDNVLNALGRLGHPTLRSKVRHRAELVSRALRKPLSNLEAVTDEAVKCRNYYVHGTPGSFGYARHGGITSFLTRALEFFFAASEFVEAGWDIARWRSGGHSLVHPFNRVLYEWDDYVTEICSLRETGQVSPNGRSRRKAGDGPRGRPPPAGKS